MKWAVDWEAYLAERVGEIRNERGGRGYDRGVRVFDCAICGETRGRGWLSVETGRAGCFNSGCAAEPSLDGGALEWVRRQEGFATRGRALAYLLTTYPLSGAYAHSLAPDPPPTEDWCKLPAERISFSTSGPGLCQYQAAAFANSQWGVGKEVLRDAQASYCLSGRYIWRIVVPVLMNGLPVAFQARTFRRGIPKYLTSRFGERSDPKAECGRPAERLLYNLDVAGRSRQVVMVEGIGDTLAISQRADMPPALALMGVEISLEKIGLLRACDFGLLQVAMDNQPDALRRGAEHVLVLREFGVPAELWTWAGAKDAGAGARLVRYGDGLLACVRGILGR